jgi:DNA-binding phage protein
MSQALSPSFARCYGLARVARVWKISRASVYRSLKETPPNTSAVALVRSVHVRTWNWQTISASK